MPLAMLPDRGVIGVGGEDARSFLDGLVTSSLAGLETGAARFAALLTPQGKIIVDFIVTADPGGLLLDVPRALAADLARKLGFYRLRARVTVDDLSETLGVAAVWDTPVPDLGTAFADPRLPALGHRIIGEREELGAAADASVDDYAARRIACGVPAGGADFVYGDTFPHEADMDLLGGVDFDKGCYVGQEVVSRMQHRGTARTRVIPVRFADGISPPEGSEALAGDKPAGRIGSAAPGGIALALLRLDRIADAMASGEPLTAGGLTFRAEKPGFADFPFPWEAVKPQG